jgi:hypothetical protein
MGHAKRCLCCQIELSLHLKRLKRKIEVLNSIRAETLMHNMCDRFLSLP